MQESVVQQTRTPMGMHTQQPAIICIHRNPTSDMQSSIHAIIRTTNTTCKYLQSHHNQPHEQQPQTVQANKQKRANARSIWQLIQCHLQSLKRWIHIPQTTNNKWKPTKKQTHKYTTTNTQQHTLQPVPAHNAMQALQLRLSVVVVLLAFVKSVWAFLLFPPLFHHKFVQHEKFPHVRYLRDLPRLTQ